MADLYNPGQEAVAQTASPNISTVQARNDPNGSVNSLLAALGSTSTQAGIAQLNDTITQKKTEEQSMKIAAYTQQFMDNNKEGGPVSQAQVKALHPELVPVIAANVAESIGKIQGGQQAAKLVAQIDGDDSLRLDTAKRTAFLEQAKSDALAANPGQQNEFYTSGLLQGINSAIAQNSGKWEAQTAAYQEGVQKVAYGQEIVQALQGPDPQAAMLQSDTNWSQKSSLNNLERNKVAVDAVIKYAQVTNNPTVLDQLPQRFLNVDSKQQIMQAQRGIQDYQISMALKKHELLNIQRTEETRKTNIDTLQQLAAGNIPNAGDPQYTSNPDARAFLQENLSKPSVPPANSMRVAETFRNSILNSSSTGSVGNVDQYMATVQRLPGLNPDDRAKLMAEGPKLLEGRVLMNSDIVRQAYRDHVQSGLDILGKSIDPKMQALLTGTNVVGQASQLFEGEIRRGYQAHYASNGNQWPDGQAQRDITDRAVQVTNDFVAKHTSIQALNGYHGDGTPPKPAGAAGAAGASAPATAIPSATKQSPLAVQIAAELAKRK